MPGLASAFDRPTASPAEVAFREAMAAACSRLEPEAKAPDVLVAPPVFRGAALELQSATDHELIIAGPSETGKTVAALWKLDTMLRETPGAKANIVRKVRADMTGTVLETWDRISAMRGGVTVYGGAHVESYAYANGSRCYIAGMDRASKVLSGERDFIYVNQVEELALDDWETLSTRCTGRGAVTAHPMLFGDCNPGPETHWILKRPGLRLLASRHEDNPTLYDDAGGMTEQGRRTMAVLDALSGHRRERLRFGRWVSAEGVVYEDWNKAVHVIKRFAIPPDWRRVCSIDFGYTNPFVWQLWAIDHDGRMYLCREIYITKQLVEDLAGKIREFSKGQGIEATPADHDAEDRATLEKHGVPTVPACKAIRPGIEAVQKRLKIAGDGKPRMFIFDDALLERDEALAKAHKPVCTADEFGSYCYPKGVDGKPNKETPLDVDNHGVDATRYAVGYVDKLVDRGWWSELPAVQAKAKEAA